MPRGIPGRSPAIRRDATDPAGGEGRSQAVFGFAQGDSGHYARMLPRLPRTWMEPAMRVLMVTSFPIPGEYDGTAMLPIKIMRALKQRGVDVVMAYLRARPPWGAAIRGEFEGTPIYEVPFSGWVSGLGLRRIAREQPFDLVHAQHYGGATRAYAACRRYGWPLVYEIHSLLGDEVARDSLGRGLVFPPTVAIENRVLRPRRGQSSPWASQSNRSWSPRKTCPAERVSVIYPGIDLAEYEAPGSPGDDSRDRA